MSQSVRWLKGAVIGMGVLILVLLTVVIIEVARRASEPPTTGTINAGRPAPPIAGAEAPAVRPPPAFGDTTIALPPGALVEETVAGGDRLIIRLGLPDGTTALLLIDSRTGRRLGLVLLEGGAPP